VFDDESIATLTKTLRRRGNVVVYTGNETPSETVDMFQRARYLVGYHGAGLVNAYFMHNDTKILEVSTFQDVNNTVRWRSNMKAVTKYGRFTTKVLRVPVQQILRANNVKLMRTYDTDHFIKNLKYVSLTDQDVYEITTFLDGTRSLL
jgi:capsular polysaccharide biosynthesis protein